MSPKSTSVEYVSIFSEKMSKFSTTVISSLALLCLITVGNVNYAEAQLCLSARSVDKDYTGTEQREGPGMKLTLVL